MSVGRYGSAASALAPIVVGLTAPDPGLTLLRRCWQVASLSVPDALVTARRPRALTMVTTADAVWPVLAKLVETVPDEPVWAALRWRWLVGARPVEPRQFGEPFTRRPAVYRVETLSYRVRDGALAQTPQLALFRHVLVNALRAADPAAAVSGGQFDWRDEWWCSPRGELSSRASG